ncbi:MAG: hypothetical protein OXG24_09265 [Gammaproteobacteria bacterium]|nr:hypothetical protein [Gammaproteobacteria bacterium]
MAISLGGLVAHPSDRAKPMDPKAKNSLGSVTGRPEVFRSVIEDPVYIDLVESAIKSTNSDLDSLLEYCDPKRLQLDHNCKELTARLFKDEPVWATSRLEYFDYFRGHNLMRASSFNPRYRKLKFDYSDYLNHPQPTWGDIFDQNTDTRAGITRNVLQDDECIELATYDGIRPELSDRCLSVDLFKWATYIAICDAAEQNFYALSAQVASPNFRHLTNYEHSVAQLRELVLDPDRRERLIKHQQKTFFLVSWLSTTCHEQSIQILSPKMSEKSLQFLSPQMRLSFKEGKIYHQDELRGLEQATHYQALRIAAKAGSIWAQSSYFPQNEGPGYWRDLSAGMPILVHRYLGTGQGLGRGLSLLDQTRHAVQAQKLLENQYPDLEVADDWYYRDLNLRISQKKYWHALINSEVNELKMPWGNSVMSSKE